MVGRGRGERRRRRRRMRCTDYLQVGILMGMHPIGIVIALLFGCMCVQGRNRRAGVVDGLGEGEFRSSSPVPSDVTEDGKLWPVRV